MVASGPTWLPKRYEVHSLIQSHCLMVESYINMSNNRTVTSTNLESDNETSDDFLPAPVTESTPSPVSSTSGSSTVVVPP